MAINSLLSKIEEQKITEIKEEIKYESTEINREHCFGSEEDPFYLQNQNFNERLTFNQIKFLKYWINNNELSIKQLSHKYWISPSVLYKIQNQKTIDIIKGPANIFNKLPIDEKNILIEN